jgi:hypothetical protein
VVVAAPYEPGVAANVTTSTPKLPVHIATRQLTQDRRGRLHCRRRLDRRSRRATTRDDVRAPEAHIRDLIEEQARRALHHICLARVGTRHEEIRAPEIIIPRECPAIAKSSQRVCNAQSPRSLELNRNSYLAWWSPGLRY